MTLQHTIDKVFIRNHNSQEMVNFDFEIASMPTIAQETIDSQRIIWFGSLYSVLFNVLLLSTFLVPLVEEKQNGIKVRKISNSCLEYNSIIQYSYFV